MQMASESIGTAVFSLKTRAQLPSYLKSLGKIALKVSTRFVVQMKYMKYCPGVAFFQAIRTVLPDLDLLVR